AATNALPKGGDFKSRQRKRAVVIKNDPESFRDALLELLVEDATFETYVSVLESNADKLDYKRYADTFFEVVIVGGIVGESDSVVLRRFYVLVGIDITCLILNSHSRHSSYPLPCVGRMPDAYMNNL
ncbi:hypothetical protein BC830DRAFT_1123266, partial [Chytriomyces sp. MP71]